MSHSARLIAKVIPAILVLVAALVIGCGGNNDGSTPSAVSSTVPVSGGAGSPSGASGASGGSGTSGTTGGSTGDIPASTTSTTTTTTGTTTTTTTGATTTA